MDNLAIFIGNQWLVWGDGYMLFAKTKHVTKKMTFTEFSENCRSNFSVQYSGKRDHEGNAMLDDPKVKQQLKLHKDALEKVGKP